MRLTSARPSPLGSAFGNVFVANLGSSMADGIARVAAPLLAARLTDDPLLVSGVAVAAMLPWLLFAIPSGIVLDRVDRRRVLAAGNGARTVLALALLALTATGALTIWWLLAVVLVYGALETLYDGAIRAVVPSVVARADLPRANSRIEAGELVVQQFLSAPFTSVLFAFSVLVPLGVGAAGYAVGAVLALLLPLAAAGDHRAPDPTPWRRQLADGLRFIMAHDRLRPLWFLSTVIGFCMAAATATLVLFVLERLGVPEAWYGVFMLAMAAGALLGAAAAAPLARRLGTGRVMAVANVASVLPVVLMGAYPAVAVSAVALGISSGAVTAWNVLVMSLRQSMIPSRLFGRVHGTWRTLLWGAMPLGSLLGGLLARVDLVTPLLVAGGVATVAALVGYRFVDSLPDPEDVEVAA